MKRIIVLILVLSSIASCAQQKVFSIEDARNKGLSIEELDKKYTSAVHSDTTKAVFKSAEKQAKLQESYVKLLTDFNHFLAKNNFKWKNKTRCFQRIYFAPNGTIDYFIYNFNLKNALPDTIPTEKEQEEFNRLLSLFVKDYVFDLHAAVPFAQCSPTSYQ